MSTVRIRSLAFDSSPGDWGVFFAPLMLGAAFQSDAAITDLDSSRLPSALVVLDDPDLAVETGFGDGGLHDGEGSLRLCTAGPGTDDGEGDRFEGMLAGKSKGVAYRFVN